ncbi:hypothetical protein V9T40_013621 [Parthenolecanium corni]|uniref:Nuclear protein MDM1 n=1 Tax=Parthenolecanium corni TaxID=536013 RepID=A0AAN9Y2S7_9HEMI
MLIGEMSAVECPSMKRQSPKRPRPDLLFFNDRYAKSRNDKRDFAPSRRSKSAGPPGTSIKRSYYEFYGSPSPDYADLSEFDAEYGLISNCPNHGDLDTVGIPVKDSRGNTEYRLQFAWPKGKHNVDSVTHEELKAAGGGSRRSAFMATTGHDRPPVPVHKKRFLDSDKKEGVAELEPLVDHQNGECETNEEKHEKTQNNNQRQFYSEYQKKFRPFSQYDYIAGKFSAKDSTITPASSLSSGSWYGEVLELRKKAGEYKHRGWGTELVPQHIAEVYNKQIALWEHVSRRSSLSALTLATTTQKPRALTKEEKSKENNRKSAPYKLRETRQASVDRAASVLRKKTEKNEEIKRHSTKSQKETLAKVNSEKSSTSAATPVTPSSTARSQPGATSSSPKKHVPRSSSSSSPKKTANNQTEPRSRSTTLAINAQTRIRRDTSVLAKKKESLKIKIPSSANAAKIPPAKVTPNGPQNVAVKNELKKNEDSEPVDKDANIIDVEHIVKSPPEPTRVKSPEQMMMKSPEPVNWTVPLDTNRTFTVTQNIPEGLKVDDAPASISSIDQSSTEKSSERVLLPQSNVNGTDSQSTGEELLKPITDAASISGPSSLIDTTMSESKSSITSSPISDPPNTNIIAKSVEETDAVPIAERISSTELLESARDRFDQFWQKPTLNGKESSM